MPETKKCPKCRIPLEIDQEAPGCDVEYVQDRNAAGKLLRQMSAYCPNCGTLVDRSDLDGNNLPASTEEHFAIDPAAYKDDAEIAFEV